MSKYKDKEMIEHLDYLTVSLQKKRNDPTIKAKKIIRIGSPLPKLKRKIKIIY
jgi:hypothetical protein